jgi:tripartite-type tricarboxylate transporter receptor subunit TctC
MEEAGLFGFSVANWAGLLGPGGLDPVIVRKLHDEVIAILDTLDMRERIAALGFDVIASGPDEFAKQLRDDVERWHPVVKAAGAEQP